MPVPKPKAISTVSEATVLTKAVLRAAQHLGMTNKSLATVIGVLGGDRFPDAKRRLHLAARAKILRACGPVPALLSIA